MNRVRLDTSLELLLERQAAGTPAAVLATVVATAGSTYRKAGARMLIEADGRITGLLSGGCLEQDLREHAYGVIASQQARVILYDMRGDDDLVFGIGAGCEGAMRILLEPAQPGSGSAAALAQAGQATRTGAVVALATLHTGPTELLGTRLYKGEHVDNAPALHQACTAAIAEGRSQPWRSEDATDAIEAWIQIVPPPPRILICGAGPDAEPLASALQALRFLVTVTDHREAHAVASRFPYATVLLGSAESLASRANLDHYFAAVVMSHHLVSDAAYLRALAHSDISYVGLLGPRARRARLLEDIGGAARLLDHRLRGPVGLDIGAVTPEGIALSIAAQLHAVAAGRAGL